MSRAKHVVKTAKPPVELEPVWSRSGRGWVVLFFYNQQPYKTDTCPSPEAAVKQGRRLWTRVVRKAKADKIRHKLARAKDSLRNFSEIGDEVVNKLNEAELKLCAAEAALNAVRAAIRHAVEIWEHQ